MSSPRISINPHALYSSLCFIQLSGSVSELCHSLPALMAVYKLAVAHKAVSVLRLVRKPSDHSYPFRRVVLGCLAGEQLLGLILWLVQCLWQINEHQEDYFYKLNQRKHKGIPFFIHHHVTKNQGLQGSVICSWRFLHAYGSRLWGWQQS